MLFASQAPAAIANARTYRDEQRARAGLGRLASKNTSTGSDRSMMRSVARSVAVRCFVDEFPPCLA